MFGDSFYYNFFFVLLNEGLIFFSFYLCLLFTVGEFPALKLEFYLKKVNLCELKYIWSKHDSQGLKTVGKQR